MGCSVVCALVLATVASWTNAACVPDVPRELLIHPQVLSHPVVLEALNEVQEVLQKSCNENVTRDGLSFAIVGSSFSSLWHHAFVQAATYKIMDLIQAYFVEL